MDLDRRDFLPGRAAVATKGRYLGRSTIAAPVDLYRSMIEGTVIVNGRQSPQGSQGW